MSLVMSDLGEIVWMGDGTRKVVGIIIGILLVSVAYPLYNSILKKEREKVAPEIIKLSDELMK